jgi:hypothetical protein
MKPAKPARSAPREFIKPRDKREELTTYRELELGRDLKSQPYLAVEAKRYRQVRLEQQRWLLLEARAMKLGLAPDRLLAQLTPRIEALTYVQLAEESSREADRHIPIPALGRALTEEEGVRFAASRALEKPNPATASGGETASGALRQILGRIEKRQTHNPARYQTIWAQLVGGDIAAQTHLEKVDPATQTAYFRCHNSVLSMDLQRRPGLAQKLAKALGLPIRQLRAKF